MREMGLWGEVGTKLREEEWRGKGERVAEEGEKRSGGERVREKDEQGKREEEHEEEGKGEKGGGEREKEREGREGREREREEDIIMSVICDLYPHSVCHIIFIERL